MKSDRGIYVNMRRLGKGILLFATVAALLTTSAFPAFAATRKKIRSVSVNIEAVIEPETRFGEEEIEVEVRGGSCSYDYYDIENVGFEWMDEDVPELTIYLRADEGYYFALTKASDVKLVGATYVKATKQDSSETLALRVKLPSMAERVGAQTEVTLADNGFIYWDDVRNAGSYEVRLYRNGTGVGASYITTETPYLDVRSQMSKPGTYSARVRGVNKINPENKGKWGESTAVTISDEQAEAIRNGSAGDTFVRGEWIYDGTGWWYSHSDGTCTKNGWEQIKSDWYFFDENGYMKTGWIDWEGNRYYCDQNSGAMLKNTTTPDGYILGSDGTPKNN